MRRFSAVVTILVLGSASALAQSAPERPVGGLLGPGPSAEGTEVVAIDKPRLGDFRLDWCLEWSHTCGKAAADEFCRRKGFAESASFVKAPRVGERTRVIGTGQVCNQASCDGFRSIT
jgi:hypothetical protein